MSQLLKNPAAMMPMMFGFAAASLLLLTSSSRPRQRRAGDQRSMLPAPPDLIAMRRRLLGLAPAHVTALLGPPRARAVAAEDTWYYPLGRSARGAMAIQFDRSRHATAVTFLPAPV